MGGYTSTGAPFFDEFLAGGYEKGIITTLYGPSGSGKTNLCLLAAVSCAREGKKVIVFDTEGGIAANRIAQLAQGEVESVLSRMMFLRPFTFDDQKRIFDQLSGLVDDDVGLIVVDSISMLYRLALGQSDAVYDVNSSLGRQIATLVEIARRKKISVLMTNQVYADFDNRDQVKMVGGDLLKYSSKCLIELKKFEQTRGMVLRKHRFLIEGGELLFRIVGDGIVQVEGQAL